MLAWALWALAAWAGGTDAPPDADENGRVWVMVEGGAVGTLVTALASGAAYAISGRRRRSEEPPPQRGDALEAEGRAADRHHAAEIASLRERVATLEAQRAAREQNHARIDELVASVRRLSDELAARGD